MTDDYRNLFEALFESRTQAKAAGMCMPPPVGCGQPITPFRDALSEREYAQSGLCQKCQDAFFEEE
jgi:hypothetical protein